MAHKQSSWALGQMASPYPSAAGDVCAVRTTYPALAGDLTLNMIFEMAAIPAGCRFVDAILDSDDLDSNGSPLITLDVGVMSGVFGDATQTRTMDASIIAADTVARAGGSVRPSLKTAFRQSASDQPQSIGVKVAAAPATAQAGTIGLTVFYVAA